MQGGHRQKVKRIAKWALFGIALTVVTVSPWVVAFIYLEPPTREITIINDTGSNIALNRCVDGPAAVHSGDRVTVHVPLSLKYDRCTVRSWDDYHYVGCLILHMPDIAPNATIPVSDVETAVRLTTCDR